MQMICRKTKYRTEIDAETQAKYILNGRRGNGIKLRSYFCTICNVWHLTSRELKNKANKDYFHELLDKINELEKSEIKLKNIIGFRDEAIKSLRKASIMHQLEISKLKRALDTIINKRKSNGQAEQ